MAISLNTDNIQGSGSMTIYGTGAGAGVNISSAGVVTFPAAPFAQGYLGGTTSERSNFTPGFHQILEQTNMTINMTLGRFTVPVAGKYLVHVQQLVITPGGLYLAIRKNGGNVTFFSYSTAQDTWDQGVTQVFDMAANDYVDFYYQGTVTYGWAGTHSSVGIVKIS